MIIVLASFAFVLVYLLVASQAPKVWQVTADPTSRLLGVLVVQALAVVAGGLALALVIAPVANSDDRSEAAHQGAAAARSLIFPVVTVIWSFFASIAHWVKHGRDQDATAETVVNKLGVPVIKVSSDPLKAELRRREEADAARQVRDRMSQRLAELQARRGELAATQAPDTNPTEWSTELLRSEVDRRDRLRRLEVEIAQLQADLRRSERPVTMPRSAGSSHSPSSDPPAANSLGPRGERAELQRRLEALQEWNRQHGEP